LAEALPRWARAEAGALLHASGADGAGRLASLLAGKGYEVRSAILYDVVASTVLPQDVVGALNNGSLDAALFFSPRSAGVFRDCILGASLCGGACATCLPGNPHRLAAQSGCAAGLSWLTGSNRAGPGQPPSLKLPRAARGSFATAVPWRSRYPDRNTHLILVDAAQAWESARDVRAFLSTAAG
jgi:hypothetical protein